MAVQVSARLINGSQVQIAAAGDEASVKIGGLYSSGARISSTGDITVSASHGLISVHTEGSLGAVALSSVNGAFQVSTGKLTLVNAACACMNCVDFPF